MHITLKAIHPRNIESLHIFIALRRLREIGDVFTAAAGAPSNANVMEGKVAIVKTHILPGLNCDSMRHELTLCLVDEWSARDIARTLTATNGDDSICESTISSHAPSRINDFSVTDTERISTHIDRLMQLCYFDSFESHLASNTRRFCDLNGR